MQDRGFPPSPPPNRFIYNVPNSNILLKFIKNPIEETTRSEAETFAVLQQAFSDIPRHPESETLPHKIHWQVGNTVLLVQTKGPARQVEKLSWLLFRFTVEGLQSFTDAYPGYNTFFQVYQKVGAAGRERKVLIAELLFGSL